MNSEVISIFRSSEDWRSFKKQLSRLSSKAKGDAFELLTKYYLILEPKYTTKLEDVWLLDEVPSGVRKHLHLPQRDQGIDLIAKTRSGEYWAIQCKYREDESKSITWREVSTFTGLAFGICKNIDFGLICTSKERYAKLLKGQTNIGFCASEVWEHLSGEFFGEVKALVSHESVTLEPFTPKSHQQRAIDKASKHFTEDANTRGKLIMPCGTGKSLTAYWITRELDAKTILVAVPSIALMRQTIQVWLREFNAGKEHTNLDWVCICSDKTVGRLNSDDSQVLIQDLGIPCLTDVQEITKWFKKAKEGGRYPKS